MVIAERAVTEHSPFEIHVGKWEGNFVNAYCNFPRSIVRACAREISFVENLPEIQVAREMGTLFAHFCNVKTGNVT